MFNAKALKTLCCAAALALALAGCGAAPQSAPAASLPQSAPAESTPVDSAPADSAPAVCAPEQQSIQIPGYLSLPLTAGTTRQTIALPNPEGNIAAFVMTMTLEDGTLLWKSDLVQPGENSGAMVLEFPLEAGTYENVTLQYDCFDPQDPEAQLNGSAIQLTLEVTPPKA